MRTFYIYFAVFVTLFTLSGCVIMGDYFRHTTSLLRASIVLLLFLLGGTMAIVFAWTNVYH